MADKRVVIEHKDGRRYSVPVAAFTKRYEPQGFRITSNEDGSAYTAPKPAAAPDKKPDA